MKIKEDWKEKIWQEIKGNPESQNLMWNCDLSPSNTLSIIKDIQWIAIAKAEQACNKEFAEKLKKISKTKETIVEIDKYQKLIDKQYDRGVRFTKDQEKLLRLFWEKFDLDGQLDKMKEIDELIKELKKNETRI